jgi:hypothetical protein
MGIFTLASSAIRKSTNAVKEVTLHTDGERVIEVSKQALSRVGITGVSSTIESGLNAASVVEGAIYKGIGIGFRAIRAGIKEQEERHQEQAKKDQEPVEVQFEIKEKN